MNRWQRLSSLLALPTLFSLLALGGCGGAGTTSASGGTNGSGSGGAAGDTSGGAGTTGSGTAGSTDSGAAGTTGSGTAGTTGSGTAGTTGSGTAGTTGRGGTTGTAGTTGRGGTTGTAGTTGRGGTTGTAGTTGRGGTTGTAGTTGSAGTGNGGRGGGGAGTTGTGTAGTSGSAGASGTSMSWQRATDPFPASCTNTGGTNLLTGPARGELYASGFCGLSKSTDGGATWNLIGDPTWPIFPAAGTTGSGIGTVAFNDLGELVAAVGMDNTAAGNTFGVWRLTGGKWTQGTGATATNSIPRMALDKTGALIAATVGNGDIWRSTDHGATFPQRAVNIGSTGPITGHEGGLVALAVDPNNGDVYAGGEPWSGLYRSQDNGVTWAYFGLAATLVSSNMQDPNGYKDNLLKIAFNRLGELLVSRNFQASSIQRLVKGGGWVQSSTGIDDLSKVHSIVLNPASGILYAGNTKSSGGTGGGIFTSTDDGATWKPFSTGYDTTLPTRGLSIGSDKTLYVMGKGSTVNSVWRTTGPVP
jgi:hypothetical protein